MNCPGGRKRAVVIIRLSCWWTVLVRPLCGRKRLSHSRLTARSSSHTPKLHAFYRVSVAASHSWLRHMTAPRNGGSTGYKIKNEMFIFYSTPSTLAPSVFFLPLGLEVNWLFILISARRGERRRGVILPLASWWCLTAPTIIKSDSYKKKSFECNVLFLVQSIIPGPEHPSIHPSHEHAGGQIQWRPPKVGQLIFSSVIWLCGTLVTVL